MNVEYAKLHMCFFDFLEPRRAPHKLSESRNVVYELMEEDDINGVKQRSIDPYYEILQVFTDPFEDKTSESREDDAYWWRRTSAIPVGAGQRRTELNEEGLEVGHPGQASDDGLGGKVPRMRNIIKDEANKVSCRQKKFRKCGEWDRTQRERL